MADACSSNVIVQATQRPGERPPHGACGPVDGAVNLDVVDFDDTVLEAIP